MGLLIALVRGTAVSAAILLAFALLKKLIIVFGVLFALLKFGILIAFVAILVMIALAIFRDRSRRKREVADL